MFRAPVACTGVWAGSQSSRKEEVLRIPYFSAYKTEFFPFQNNPKNLDPSCKMDLDL